MLNLTSDERKVILFLVSLALLGVGISFGSKKIPRLSHALALGQDIFKLDLNQVDKERLLEIPGIGVKLAERILEYRRENGHFRNKEELQNIRGITQFRYEKLKQYFR